MSNPEDLLKYLVPALSLLFGVGVLLAVAVAAGSIARSASMAAMEKWAAANRLTILHAERRHFLKGPFFFTASNTQSVYRISVRDAAGVTWHGWARCGGWWLGPLTGGLEIRWGGRE